MSCKYHMATKKQAINCSNLLALLKFHQCCTACKVLSSVNSCHHSQSVQNLRSGAVCLLGQLGSSRESGNVMRDHSEHRLSSFQHNHIINLLILPLIVSLRICLCLVHNGEEFWTCCFVSLFWKVFMKAHSFTGYRGLQTK